MLIIAFLATLGVAAFVDVREPSTPVRHQSGGKLDLTARMIAEGVDRIASSETGDVTMRGYRAFERFGRARDAAAGHRPPHRRHRHGSRDATNRERVRWS